VVSGLVSTQWSPPADSRKGRVIMSGDYTTMPRHRRDHTECLGSGDFIFHKTLCTSFLHTVYFDAWEQVLPWGLPTHSMISYLGASCVASISQGSLPGREFCAEAPSLPRPPRDGTRQRSEAAEFTTRDTTRCNSGEGGNREVSYHYDMLSVIFPPLRGRIWFLEGALPFRTTGNYSGTLFFLTSSELVPLSLSLSLSLPFSLPHPLSFFSPFPSLYLVLPRYLVSKRKFEAFWTCLVVLSLLIRALMYLLVFLYTRTSTS